MKKFIFLSIFILSLVSCKHEIQEVLPQIHFSTDSSFIYKDTSLSLGNPINCKIIASSEPAEITNFVITRINEKNEKEILLDSGMYTTNLEFNTPFFKGMSEQETITFMVMNKQRKKSWLTLHISLIQGGEFSNVDSLSNVVLGAQNNLNFGSFLATSSGQTFFIQEAYQHQEIIDMAYYYDQYESTLSSPADNDAPSVFQGEFGISGWSVRNETRYHLTTLGFPEFSKCKNDSLLFAVFEPANAKRKGKYAKAGDVWAFQLPGEKLGLLYIHEIVGTDEGYLKCSLKFQK